jgi:hypothetical protein
MVGSACFVPPFLSIIAKLDAEGQEEAHDEEKVGDNKS